MYNVYSFLEPLGLLARMPLPDPIVAPTPSQESAGDPWNNSFPPDRKTYKLHDEDDNIDRCPACLHEVEETRCNNCNAEFSGEEDDDEFEFEEMDFEEDDIVGSRAGGLRRRGARVNIAHVDEVFGDSEDDNPAAARQRRRERRQVAEQNGMFFDEEAEEVEEDMVDSGSESEDSGTSEFARPRTDIDLRHSDASDFDSESDLDGRPRNFIDFVTGDTGGAGARPLRRQPAEPSAHEFRGRVAPRRIGGPVGRSHRVDSADPSDISGNESATHDTEPSVYDSEEDDGAVPRRFPRPRITDSNEEEYDTYDSQDSFIDDDVDIDQPDESNDTENENNTEEMIQLASSDHEVQSDEEREEDGAGQVPNIQEIRRRRLEALIDGRRLFFPSESQELG